MDGEETASANSWRYRGWLSPATITSARHSLDEWVRGQGGQEVAADVVLACWEGMSNVLRHAYFGADGPIEMRAEVADGVLTVRITDHGHWRDPGAGSGTGRGFKLIQALADAVDLTSHGDGTALTLSWPLSETSTR